MRLFPASITPEQEGGLDEVRQEAMERGEENAIVKESPTFLPTTASLSIKGYVVEGLSFTINSKGRFRVRIRTLYCMQ